MNEISMAYSCFALQPHFETHGNYVNVKCEDAIDHRSYATSLSRPEFVFRL